MRKAHPARLVPAEAELIPRLEGKGFHVSRDALLEGYNGVFADDPFGSRTELMEPRLAAINVDTE